MLLTNKLGVLMTSHPFSSRTKKRTRRQADDLHLLHELCGGQGVAGAAAAPVISSRSKT